MVYSKRKTEHEEHLHKVLETLRANKLYAKFSKCEFWLKQVAFLGHVVSSEGVYVDPLKIEVVTSWSRPSIVSEVTTTEIGYLTSIRCQVNIYLTFLKASSNQLSSIVTLLDTKKSSIIRLVDTVFTSNNLSHLTFITCQVRSYT